MAEPFDLAFASSALVTATSYKRYCVSTKEHEHRHTEKTHHTRTQELWDTSLAGPSSNSAAPKPVNLHPHTHLKDPQTELSGPSGLLGAFPFCNQDMGMAVFL